tara:strand:+ start:33559 stop:34386 length:828 start_codon:yes stop_codon:yes gene_type:complete
MAFMLIPPRDFFMGSSEAELAEFLEPADARNEIWPHNVIRSEGPRRKVLITRPSYIGKYEITQAQWQAVEGNNPAEFKISPPHPVDMVSWDDIQSFLEKVNKEPSLKLRFPTEAQWEYAARAGTTTRWHCGDTEEDANQLHQMSEPTNPVGQKQANAFGIHDMIGNVNEWCADRYAPDYYAKSATNDPTGPAKGNSRIQRGGSIMHHANYCRSAFRLAISPYLRFKSPYLRFKSHGLRLAMPIDVPKLNASNTAWASTPTTPPGRLVRRKKSHHG